ncbi:phosphoglycerate dehydrogenase [Bacillus sp. JJ1562]|uniref:phosphoglycerate dehydrogenase n=1 Tax=Bacillus sp. JJ1562 TaxID=3122960 RepID=UPI003002F194
MYKVVSSSPTFGKYSKLPINYLEKEQCTVSILDKDTANDEERLAIALKEADALVVGVEKISKRVIDAAENLKVIAKHGAGVDNIDLQAAKERNISVAFAPGANKHAVAELAFGLLLSLAREIPQTNRRVINGEWPRVVGSELYGKTLGVVGTGRIGKEVINRASGFNMDILAFDVYQDQELLESGVKYENMDVILEKSDFITIHTDLNAQSKNLFSHEAFKKMKKNAYIVNTARGGIIDEMALYDALISGEISGAALDVFENEPTGNSPLISLPNFIATPHMAGYTADALEEVGMITARNIINVLKGEKADFEFV